jgi:hydrogenase maturation protease
VTRPRTLVIGLGHPLRGDDGVGAAVVAELCRRSIPGFEALVFDGDGAALVDRWDGAERVIVVDATRSNTPPGTVERLDAASFPLPRTNPGGSSHGFGLAEAFELARTLGRLPPRLIIYGVAGGSFGMGEGLSPAVAAAVPEVVERILKELGTTPQHTS